MPESRTPVARMWHAADCPADVASSDTVDAQQFWELIDTARRQIPEPADGSEVAARAAALLSMRPRGEIVAADQVLRSLMADSYRSALWAAGYVINGGGFRDGFGYFPRWLLFQSRAGYGRGVGGPRALAAHPVLRPPPPGGSGCD